MSGATAGETAVVLATDTGDPDLRALVAVSFERLGCEVSEVIVRSGAVLDGRDPVGNDAVASALINADLVVDLGVDLVERSGARAEILDEARVLVLDLVTTSELDHLVAHPGLARRLDRAQALLRTGEKLTLASAAGTLMEIALADCDVGSTSGVAKTQGEIAHWPAGLVWARPDPTAVNGCVVVMPGDLVVEAAHVMRSPVRIEIRNGHLVDVLGDTTDADVLRSYLEGLDDERVYGIADVGWGMNLTRHRSELDLFDSAQLSVGRGPLSAGRVNVRTGHHDPSEDVGVTLSLAHASVTIDEVPVVSDGSLEGSLAPDVYERAAGS